MSMALDLGAYRFRSLRRDGRRLLGRSCRAVYALLPDSASQRRLLEQSGIPFATCEQQLVLLGDVAAHWSRLFQVPLMPLLPSGRLLQSDPLVRQILGVFIEALLPTPERHDALCGLALPSGAVARRARGEAEWEFFRHLLRLRGYTPILIGQALAAALAELADRSFNGLVLNMGASGCEFSAVHCGKEVIACVLPRGGDWIDEQLASDGGEYLWDPQGNRRLDLQRAAHEKESCTTNVCTPIAAREHRLSELYVDLVRSILEEAAKEVRGSAYTPRLPQPMTLLYCGGTTRIPGFAQLLEQGLRELEFPVRIREIRPASDPNYTVARGCLINTELEADTAQRAVA